MAALTAVTAGLLAACGGEEQAGCYGGLSGHVPDEVTRLNGGDLEAARAAGFVDSADVEELAASYLDHGLLAEPLTRRQLSVIRPLDGLGYRSEDVECWIGGLDWFVASGSFDDDSVTGSLANDDTPGSLLTDGDRLAWPILPAATLSLRPPCSTAARRPNPWPRCWPPSVTTR